MSDERLQQIDDERPHLIIQDDEFQLLAMDLRDARERIRALEALVRDMRAGLDEAADGWPRPNKHDEILARADALVPREGA